MKIFQDCGNLCLNVTSEAEVRDAYRKPQRLFFFLKFNQNRVRTIRKGIQKFLNLLSPSINGASCTLSNDAKYLEIIWESKLNWNLNTQLCSVITKAMGVNLDISPEIVSCKLLLVDFEKKRAFKTSIMRIAATEITVV